MGCIRNETQGARTVRLRDGSYVLVEAGGEVSIAEGKIARLAPGLVRESVPPPPAKLQARALDAAFSGFLDRAAPLIVADLAGVSDDDLRGYRAAESGGKSRKGLIAAIDAEIEARRK